MTGNKKYLDAAMVLFREVRDKMRDGPFIGSGSYARDFMKPGASPFGGGRASRRRGTAPPAAGRAAAGAAPGARAGRGAGAPGGPGAGWRARRHGVNLHMFEALMGLYEATKSEEVWYEITSELKAIERLYDYDHRIPPRRLRRELEAASATRAAIPATCSSGPRC